MKAKFALLTGQMLHLLEFCPLYIISEKLFCGYGATLVEIAASNLTHNLPLCTFLSESESYFNNTQIVFLQNSPQVPRVHTSPQCCTRSAHFSRVCHTVNRKSLTCSLHTYSNTNINKQCNTKTTPKTPKLTSDLTL